MPSNTVKQSTNAPTPDPDPSAPEPAAAPDPDSVTDVRTGATASDIGSEIHRNLRRARSGGVAARASTPEDTTADRRYEPYPTAEFFHGGRHSPIITAMARRLQAEGFATDGKPMGPDWTNAHRAAYAAFQHSLHPRDNADATGIPDASSWRQLKVPRVSPLPKEPR